MALSKHRISQIPLQLEVTTVTKFWMGVEVMNVTFNTNLESKQYSLPCPSLRHDDGSWNTHAKPQIEITC